MDPNKGQEIYATMKNRSLIGETAPYTDVALTGPGRILNAIGDNQRVKVLVENGKVIQLLQHQYAEAEKQKQEAKQDRVSDLMRLLRSTTLNFEFKNAAFNHFNGNADALAKEIRNVIQNPNMRVISVGEDGSFQLTESSDPNGWKVAGWYATGTGGTTLTIRHYGQGTLY